MDRVRSDRLPSRSAMCDLDRDGGHVAGVSNTLFEDTELANPLLDVNRAVAPGSKSLRRSLVVTDIVSAMAAWLITLASPAGRSMLSSAGHLAAGVLLMTAVTLSFVASQRLFASRVCQIRTIELVRLSRVAVLSSLTGLVAARWIGFAHQSVGLWIGGAVVVFLLMALARSVFGHWLRVQRAAGTHTRDLIIVGSNDEGRSLADLIQCQPELGYRLVGYVGTPEPGEWSVPCLGGVAEVPAILERAGVSSVLVAASAMSSPELNRLIRELLEQGKHVHISSGLAGVDHRRLRPLPMGHEPLFYIEQRRPSRVHLVAKRTLDVVLASTALVIASPVLLIAAIAIKVADRGPVVYRQPRIGRDGNPFTFYKLRTMVPGADQQLYDLRGNNARRDGPLFKAADDPRVTRVGRFLRASSIDELPQLVNVVNGTMSLVGPRPALAHEVAVFDEDLLARMQMRPGITGLWQVEARDNPAFSAYRRLDIFYIENWSISLDVAILLSTLPVVLARAVPSKGRSSELRAEPSKPAIIE
jgi:exopolysaccharide biosynthesis polyprenyl glycosylphosphotransferase